jgi:methylenetetrahydrofolate dehydrogenase (NADP+)/methenyltetrahydrofolate cyclohydrolase
LESITKSADILIVACGVPKFINATHVREGQVMVDVGIHKTEDGMCGDVDFDSVKDIASYITPVPGGVGPLTVVSLFQNLLDAWKL